MMVGLVSPWIPWNHKMLQQAVINHLPVVKILQIVWTTILVIILVSNTKAIFTIPLSLVTLTRTQRTSMVTPRVATRMERPIHKMMARLPRSQPSLSNWKSIRNFMQTETMLRITLSWTLQIQESRLNKIGSLHLQVELHGLVMLTVSTSLVRHGPTICQEAVVMIISMASKMMTKLKVVVEMINSLATLETTYCSPSIKPAWL